MLSLDQTRTDESLMAELSGQQETRTADLQGVPVGVGQVRRVVMPFFVHCEAYVHESYAE